VFILYGRRVHEIPIFLSVVFFLAEYLIDLRGTVTSSEYFLIR
jgi:hypothetical protein